MQNLEILRDLLLVALHHHLHAFVVVLFLALEFSLKLVSDVIPSLLGCLEPLVVPSRHQLQVLDCLVFEFPLLLVPLRQLVKLDLEGLLAIKLEQLLVVDDSLPAPFHLICLLHNLVVVKLHRRLIPH